MFLGSDVAVEGGARRVLLVFVHQPIVAVEKMTVGNEENEKYRQGEPFGLLDLTKFS